MFPSTVFDRSRAARSTMLLLILVVASVARFWAIGTGVPFAVGIDEPQIVNRALAILHTGDWNTHLFDYPTLVIYLQAVVEIVRFLWGAVRGEWASLDAFNVKAIYMSGRIVAASIGVASVWLTYRLGAALSTRTVGLLGAAELAIGSSHVRESHFILTDVPATALTTAAVWMAVRAGDKRTVKTYIWAGALCGLAAAAKYTGGVAGVAVAAVWLIHERSSADRWTKAGAAIAAAIVAFLIAAPYTLLDLPGFLDGFAHQFARFAIDRPGTEPAWLLYMKHLSLNARWRLPLALCGAVAALWRADSRARWTPLIAFTVAFGYVLGTHKPVFARYALPLLPMLDLLTSIAIVELIALACRTRPLKRPRTATAFAAIVIAILLVPMARVTAAWLDDQKHPDTRAIAAEWLEKTARAGSRVAVENSGPTYLNSAGFRVVGTLVLLDHPVEWYRSRADYLIISSGNLSRYGAYLSAGPEVLQIAPTPQRWGPAITVVKIQ